MLLAIDPGRMKCGFVLAEPGPAMTPGALRILRQAVVPTAEILSVWQEAARLDTSLTIIVGAGTGSSSLITELRSAGAVLALVEEKFSTQRARERYFIENPPRGWRRLVPRGLLTPPVPVDDFAALILAEEWYAQQASLTTAALSTTAAPSTTAASSTTEVSSTTETERRREGTELDSGSRVRRLNTKAQRKKSGGAEGVGAGPRDKEKQEPLERKSV